MILRLDVAVDDVVLVCVLKCVPGLAHDVEHERGVQLAALALLIDQLLQCAAIDVLGDDVMHLARFARAERREQARQPDLDRGDQGWSAELPPP